MIDPRDPTEFDPNQLTIQVTPELGYGLGALTSPDHKMSDEVANEKAEVMHRYVERVSLDAPCGCMDGRCALHLLDGSESLVKSSLAGGGAISSLVSMELNDVFKDGGDVYDHMVTTVNMLEGRNESVWFHVDSKNAPRILELILEKREEYANLSFAEFMKALKADNKIKSGTGCAMALELEGVVSSLANRPRTYKDHDEVERIETAEQVTKRLDFARYLTKAMMPKTYGDDNDAIFDWHVARATQMVDEEHFKLWDDAKILVLVDRILRDRGVENGVLGRIDVLDASAGHIESFIDIELEPGETLNQTRYTKETESQAFSIDPWKGDVLANKLTQTISGDPEKQKKELAQGIVEANVAGAIHLADGTHRGVLSS